MTLLEQKLLPEHIKQLHINPSEELLFQCFQFAEEAFPILIETPHSRERRLNQISWLTVTRLLRSALKGH